MSHAYYADGALVPRERFYALACDPARSAVVEACAGAGKTWMLVSRILRALLAGAAPQEIVAITFTRKAAGEMRERLLEWLAEFAAASAGRRVAELIARGMGEADAAAAAPRLAALQDDLLRGGRPVEIRTFHGWFSQLLRAAPLAVLQAEGLSADLQLIEDESELMPQLWRRFHARVLADAELAAAFQALTETRGRHNLREWLLAAFGKRVELRLAARAGVLAGSMPDVAAPLQALAALRPNLAALAGQLGCAKGAKARDAATGIEQALALADDGAFPALWAALFTKTGTAKKGLGDSATQLDACAALEAIAADIAQHEAAIEHARMARLAEVLVGEFEALKRERGLVDMNDLERGALALLSRPELAGWVQQRLDARVRHLLIDEFQDTSPLQWQALHGWLSAYAGAGASEISVFIVGDPKQSIYRFRRAEPRVFAAAGEFVREGLGGVALACDHTRRNAPEVLAAVNTAFEGQMPGFRPHTTEQGADAAAGLFSLDGDLAEADAAEARDPDRWRPSLTEAKVEAEVARRAPECARVARVIRMQLAAGLRPRDVFVLARKREPLRQMAEALLAAGIPHVAPEDNRLADLPDAQDLIALLDALASPGHALSLARALRSPLFGVDEADLLQLAQAAGSAAWLGRPAPRERRSWWDALADIADPSPALARARALLLAWREAAMRCTPHELLDRIVHEGELLPRLIASAPPSEAPNRLRTVNALLQAALELDGGRFAELYGFVRALKARSPKLAPAPAASAEAAHRGRTAAAGARGAERAVCGDDARAAPARRQPHAAPARRIGHKLVGAPGCAGQAPGPGGDRGRAAAGLARAGASAAAALAAAAGRADARRRSRRCGPGQPRRGAAPRARMGQRRRPNAAVERAGRVFGPGLRTRRRCPRAPGRRGRRHPSESRLPALLRSRPAALGRQRGGDQRRRRGASHRPPGVAGRRRLVGAGLQARRDAGARAGLHRANAQLRGRGPESPAWRAREGRVDQRHRPLHSCQLEWPA
jgi:ATP-dependent helicase/nuclease subunit A